MNKQLAGKCREGDSRGSDLKGLGDDVVVEADVVPAVAAAVDARPHQLRHRPSPRRAASPEYPRPDQSCNLRNQNSNGDPVQKHQSNLVSEIYSNRHGRRSQTTHRRGVGGVGRERGDRQGERRRRGLGWGRGTRRQGRAGPNSLLRRENEIRESQEAKHDSPGNN